MLVKTINYIFPVIKSWYITEKTSINKEKINDNQAMEFNVIVKFLFDMKLLETKEKLKSMNRIVKPDRDKSKI